MNDPLVTVYIVNFNYLKYIEKAVQSVLSQSYKKIEVIIIDDCSTDGSQEFLKSYHDYPNIRVVLNTKNLGLTKVNNIAIKLSSGQYIMRLDADDYLDPNAIKILLEKFSENPEYAMVFGDWYNVDKDENILSEERRFNIEEVELLDMPAHGACTMFKTGVLRRINGYDESIKRQDGYDIWLKLIFDHKVANVQTPIFYYRNHGNSLSSNRESLLESRHELFKKHAPRLNSRIIAAALLTIRNTEIEPNEVLYEEYENKTLLEVMLQNLHAAEQIDKIFIATSDKRVIDFVNKLPDFNINVLFRPKELEYLHVDIQSTLNYFEAQLSHYDAILFRSLQSPFVSSTHIDAAVNYMRIFEVNEVIAVVPEDDSMYSYSKKGMTRVFDPNSRLRREGDQLYRKVPGFKLWSGIANAEVHEWRVGNVILDEFSAITDQYFKLFTKWSKSN